jgi:hypothetical protein
MNQLIARNTAILATLALASTIAPEALAAPVPFFNSVSAGASSFDTTVTSTGATVRTSTWPFSGSPGTTVDFGDYSVNRINGGSISFDGYDTLTGGTININPSSRDVILSRQSGINFTFDNPVNALGFEVGDWGTCCQPSALYISFDNGTPIQVGLSTVSGDVFFNGKSEVFVGAIDDSGTFSTVQFWGDGTGEFLVAGGTIRYAAVPEGSVDPSDDPAIPEPSTMLGIAAAGIFGSFVRRKRD